MTKAEKTKISKGMFALIAVLAVLIVVFVIASISACSKSEIIRNVQVGGVSLRGLTVESAEEKLSQELPLDFGKITLKLGDKTSEVDTSAFVMGYDYELTAQNAYNVCRSGNIFSRVFSVIKTTFVPQKLSAEVFYDESVIDSTIEKILENADNRVEEFSYEVTENSLVFHTGHEGQIPDKSFIADEIKKAVSGFNTEKPIVFKDTLRKPEEIDADKFLKELSSEPQNATYHLSSEGEVFVLPHKDGIVLNEKDFRKQVSANKGPDKTFEVKAEIKKAKFTKEVLEERIFTKTLSSYSTTFNTGDVPRSKNVVLATKKINGVILLPGDEFSYNGVVGERTAENGFSVAHVYVNGETVDGLGGGICQVSSTLYNAVLYSNLKVTERLNHQLTVGYVPLGQDATVDYGNIDFKFKNNMDYPIKIVATANGGTVKISLLGYRDDESFSVKMENYTISIVPSPEEEVEDPTLPKGERKISKKGGTGAVVETYKNVTENGKTTRTFVSKSVYGASKTIVLVGTGETEEQEGDTSLETPTDENIPASTQPPAPPVENANPAPVGDEDISISGEVTQ